MQHTTLPGGDGIMERKLFGEEHRIFRDSLGKFIDREISPHFDQWETDGVVPREAWSKMGENGFLCPWLEEKYGGSGADFLCSIIICEELFYRGVTGLVAPLHSDIIVPYIYKLGNEEQKRRWLPGCASGEILTALAMTEPDTGSDVAAIRTTAIRDGDHYIVNGQKTFISIGVLSDLVIVAAKTIPKPAIRG